MRILFITLQNWAAHLIVFSSTLSAQSPRENTEKYWLYRERLIDSFIVVGPGIGEGIPAANYDNFHDRSGQFQWTSVLGWGDGRVEAKRLKITVNGWCDYVFDKNYDLRSLDQVNAYIQANGHLPEVPSTAEITAQGLDVGDMDALLLK
jgi:hypothetical protein